MPNVKSFQAFKKAKGKEWKNMVSKNKPDKEVDVQVMIGMKYYDEREMRLKSMRGKRVALPISNKAPYNTILTKATEKFSAYHKDVFDADQDYILVFDSGEEAQFIPGSNPKEFFTLKRYKEDLGKDYNKITLFLCPVSDIESNLEEVEDEQKEDESSISKKRKVDDVHVPDQTCESDEAFAIRLQGQFDDEDDFQLSASVSPSDDKKEEVVGDTYLDTASILNEMHRQVKQEEDFFIVMRRGAPLTRVIDIWQRQAKKVSPENSLRVKYCGESGIDTGALSQEFFSDAIKDIGKCMFPNGAPANSMYNVLKKSFKTCGEIVAVSLANGGPAPMFMSESVLELMLNPDVDMSNLSEKHFTSGDIDIFKQIRSCSEFDDALVDIISEHGYTGAIDKAHEEDIIGTIKVSIINKRLLFLREFAEGLKLFNAYELIKRNADICKHLFTASTSAPDADYVVSILSPVYSESGTTKRQLEETLIDNFQDFLNTIEDNTMTGPTEELAWNEESAGGKDSAAQESLEVKESDLSPAGVLGWLTGQKHRPLNNEKLVVTVYFDHDCKTRAPKHTICYPIVGACGKTITFPVLHMVDKKEFQQIFIQALCKGGAFGKA